MTRRAIGVAITVLVLLCVALFCICTSALAQDIDFKRAPAAGGGSGDTLPVVDTTAVVKGSVDPTKLVAIQADSCAAGTTCTFTVTANTTLPIASQPITLTGPTAARSFALVDADATFAFIGQAQTFSAANVASGVWSFGASADATNGIELNETPGHITFRGAEPDNAEHRITAAVNPGFDIISTTPALGATQVYIMDVGSQTISGSKSFSAASIFSNTVDLQSTTTVTGNNGIGFGGSISTIGGVASRAEMTPDAPVLYTGSASRSWHIYEVADAGFDFANGDCGTSACADPHIIIHSRNQSVDEFAAIFHNATQPVVRTAGNANGRPVALHGGTAVASAATITPTGNAFHVTGTTGITAITAMGSGTTICLVFDGALTLTDNNGALNLAGDFTTTANDVLCLVSDGTNWYEASRSVN